MDSPSLPFFIKREGPGQPLSGHRGGGGPYRSVPLNPAFIRAMEALQLMLAILRRPAWSRESLSWVWMLTPSAHVLMEPMS